MKNRKTVAMFGMGRAGALHCENVIQFADVRVKYIVDPYCTSEQELWAKNLGIPHICRDGAAAFADPDVDCVMINSPTPTHTAYIIEAARAGKHIFCEKPIDRSVENIRKVIAAVDEAGVKFMVGFVRRFDHNHAGVSRLVRSGDLGRPELVCITSRDPGVPPRSYLESCGGLFFDMMIHDFDMARYLVDSDVTEVYATGGVLVDPIFAEFDDIDTSVVSLKFANGALGQITNSRRATYGYDQRVEVLCDKGCVQDFNVTPTNVTISTNDGITGDKPLLFMFERYNAAFAAEAREFFDAINEDRQPIVGAKDGLHATLIAWAAQKSYEERRPVTMEEIQKSNSTY